VWKQTEAEAGAVLWKHESSGAGAGLIEPRARQLEAEPCSWKGKALEQEQFNFDDAPQPCYVLLHSVLCIITYCYISGSQPRCHLQYSGVPRANAFFNVSLKNTFSKSHHDDIFDISSSNFRENRYEFATGCPTLYFCSVGHRRPK